MALNAIIMLMGMLIAIVPYLGFPVSWFRILYLVLGIIVIVLGILVRRRGSKVSVTQTDVGTVEFIESHPRETDHQ